jgi:hypothetical protein
MTPEPIRRILIVGESGTGKTTLATTFPGRKLFLDLDCQAEGMFPPDRIGVDLFYASFADKLPVPVVNKSEWRPTTWNDAAKLLSDVSRRQEISLTMLGKPYTLTLEPNDYLVVDSLACLVQAMLRDAVYNANKSLAPSGLLPEYNTTAFLTDRILQCGLSMPCNFVVIAHDKLIVHEETGLRRWEIIKYGKTGDSQVGQLFNEVWRLRIQPGSDGVRYVQTSATSDAWAKTHLNVPATVVYRLDVNLAAEMLATGLAQLSTQTQTLKEF